MINTMIFASSTLCRVICFDELNVFSLILVAFIASVPNAENSIKIIDSYLDEIDKMRMEKAVGEVVLSHLQWPNGMLVDGL